MSEQIADGGKSPKPSHHFGRGGAGNVIAKPTDGATGQVKTTPTLKSNVYTTGRGGTGNMAKNDGPEEARAAQDVDIPGITLPEGPHHTGRGGAANTYSPDDSELLEAKEHNERVRKESINSTPRGRPSGVKAVAEKAKEVVKGKTDQS